MNYDNNFLLIAFKKYLKSCSRSEVTIKNYESIILRFYNRYSVEDYRYPSQEQLVSFIGDDAVSVVTRYNRHNGLKVFFNWMEEESKIISNAMLKIPTPKLPSILPRRVPTAGEVQRILDGVSLITKNRYVKRDSLILHLMYCCSLRRGEAVLLNIQDYCPQTKSLRIRASGTKTRTGRIVPIGTRAIKLLEKFVADEREPAKSDAMFNNYKGERLSRGYVTHLVTRIVKRLKIRSKPSSHGLRKGSGSAMLRNNASLIQVSNLLGITDISQTMRYTKVYPKSIIEMHKSKHPLERHKAMIMPDLTIPIFLYETESHRFNHSNSNSEMFRMHDKHFPFIGELPILGIPQFMDSSPYSRKFQ